MCTSVGRSVHPSILGLVKGDPVVFGNLEATYAAHMTMFCVYLWLLPSYLPRLSQAYVQPHLPIAIPRPFLSLKWKVGRYAVFVCFEAIQSFSLSLSLPTSNVYPDPVTLLTSILIGAPPSTILKHFYVHRPNSTSTIFLPHYLASQSTQPLFHSPLSTLLKSQPFSYDLDSPSKPPSYSFFTAAVLFCTPQGGNMDRL